MKLIHLGKHCCLLIIVLSILVNEPSVHAVENSVPSELSLILYADGVVDIDYELDIDPTLARINLTLFGNTYENLLVKDYNGILLDYHIHQRYVTVDVLGSDKVEIDYSTPDLTNKLGSIWSLNVITPINLNIQLPKGATIISLTPSPISIRTYEERTSLTMPMGNVNISYILGVVGSKDHALALMKEAEIAIEAFRSEGFNVENALILLKQAEDAFDEGQYIKSEELARKVKEWIIEIRAQAIEADDAIEIAIRAIVLAEDEKRTSLLDDAKEELSNAQTEYSLGNYVNAKLLAEQAALTAGLSKTVSWLKSIPLLSLIGSVVTAPLIYVYFFRKRKNEITEFYVEPTDEIHSQQKSEDKLEEKYFINLELIFDENRFLRLDDKEVIRFICKLGGGVFASELRERFKLPKSSAWRMIRRLEKEDIITTKKVGRETFIQINDKYILLGTEGVESVYQVVSDNLFQSDVLN